MHVITTKVYFVVFQHFIVFKFILIHCDSWKSDLLEIAELPVWTQCFTNIPSIQKLTFCIPIFKKLVFTRRQNLRLNPTLPSKHNNQQNTALLESSLRMAKAKDELLLASPHQDLIGKHLTRELPILSWYILN